MELHKNDLLALSIATLVTVFVWIGFGAYRTAHKNTIPAQTESLGTVLVPTIREDVLRQLEQAQP